MPNLRQLSIKSTTGYLEATHRSNVPLFTRLSFPKLERFSYCSDSDDEHEPIEFPSLGATVRALHYHRPILDDEHAEDTFLTVSSLPKDVTRCNLRELSIRLRNEDELDTLRTILERATQLETLRIDETLRPSAFETLEPLIVQLFKDQQPVALKKISLPPLFEDSETAERTRVRTSATCTMLGIEVRQQSFEEFRSEWSAMRSWSECVGE